MQSLSTSDDELMKKLEEGKQVSFVPQGISMLPFILGGRDKVIVGKNADVEVGDIVLVSYRGHLILHRVYAIHGSRLTLMGDGNLKGTEEVGKDEVMGTVLSIIKQDGRYCMPKKAWLWRHTLPVRRPLLKLRRKWYKLRHLNPE